MSPNPPRVVADRFELLEHLGGPLYRARRRNAPGTVRLLVLSADMVDGHAGFRRFHAHARRASEMHSPHVLRVLEAGHDHEKGCVFVASEDHRGFTTGEYVEKHGPLEPRLAAAWLAGLARALIEAQSLELLHGDIRPETVFLVEEPDPGGDGRRFVLKVEGYGLDPTLRDGAREEAAAPDDIRPDLKALGGLLHHLLLGVAGEHGRDDPPAPLPDRLPDGAPTPPPLRTLYDALYHPEPQRRPYRADAVATILSAVATGRDVDAKRALGSAGAPVEVLARANPEIAAILGDGGSVSDLSMREAATREARRDRRRKLVTAAGVILFLLVVVPALRGLTNRMGSVISRPPLPLNEVLKPIPATARAEGIPLEEALAVVDDDPDLGSCFEGQGTGPGDTRYVARLRLGADGAPASIEIGSEGPAHASTVACLRARAVQWRFPEPESGAARVEVPLPRP